MVSQNLVILMTSRPEDMFGSLEVDANGQFVGSNGNYQPSGMFCFSNWFGLTRPLNKLQVLIEL